MTLDAGLKGRVVPGFPSEEPDRFLLSSAGEEDRQAKLLQRVLECCREAGVSILALPEPAAAS